MTAIARCATISTSSFDIGIAGDSEIKINRFSTFSTTYTISTSNYHLGIVFNSNIITKTRSSSYVTRTNAITAINRYLGMAAGCKRMRNSITAITTATITASNS